MFSVGGFGMETSNFGLYDCPRVSIEAKFDAGSNGGLRSVPTAQWRPQFTKNVVFDEFFMDFRTFFDIFCQNSVLLGHCVSNLSTPINWA